MKTWCKTAIAAIAAIVLAMPVSAHALTYLGNRSIGLGSAALSITTDGTLGILGLSNIVGWTIGLDGGAFTLFGPDGAQNSRLRSGGGAALFATATDITFDFGFNVNARSFIIFDTPDSEPLKKFYCVQTGQGCLGDGVSGEADSSSGTAFQFTPRSGVVVLASVATTGNGVPEPAAWALMIAGFGIVGGAMRKRRPTANVLA